MLKIQFDEISLKHELDKIITHSDDGNKLFAQNIKSHLEAYGTSYDFLSFYQYHCDNETIDKNNKCIFVLCIYNSMCLCCGLNLNLLSKKDAVLINDFIFNFLKPSTISCPKNTFDTLLCKFSSYININQNTNIEYDILKKTTSNKNANENFELVSFSPWDFCTFLKNNYDEYNVSDFDKWYCDISHKTRHFQTKLFALRQKTTNKIVCACSLDFSGDDFKYISSLCTQKSCRNKGFAKILLSFVENTDQKESFLMTATTNIHLVEYYKKTGYQNCGHAVIIDTTNLI